MYREPAEIVDRVSPFLPWRPFHGILRNGVGIGILLRT
jgi:hypothetical protein